MATTTRSPLSTPPPVLPPQEVPDGIDEIMDLTDRRRVLLLALFGVEVAPDTVDLVFDDVVVLRD